MERPYWIRRVSNIFTIEYNKKYTETISAGIEIGIIFRNLTPTKTSSTILGKPVYAHGGYRYPIIIKQPNYKGNLFKVLKTGEINLAKKTIKGDDCKNPKITNDKCYGHFKVDIKNNADLTVRFRPFFKVLNGNKEIYRDYLMSKRVSYIAYILGRRQEISKIFYKKPMIYINSGKSLTLNSSPISIPLKKGKYTSQVFIILKRVNYLLRRILK